MISPVSRFVPINTKLTYSQWGATNLILKKEGRQLKKTRCGQVEEQLWLMERQEYLKELKERNLPHILGSLLNGENRELPSVFRSRQPVTA